MFFRIYPTADTFVTNEYSFATRATGANGGASEILQMFNKLEGGGTSSANILVKFELAQLPALPTGSASFAFRMYNAEHDEAITPDFRTLISAMSESWTEGHGHDIDTYTDLDVANWLTASNGVPWGTPGALQPGAATVEVNFPSGSEDLEADVTPMVASGTASFMVMPLAEVSGDLDGRGVEYYVKKFHSRQTHFLEKRPYLEARWEDWTGSLTTIPRWMAASGAWSGSYLDPRLSGTVSGTLVDYTDIARDPTGSIAVVIYNLKSVYRSDEVVTLHVSVAPKDWNPATVASASSVAPAAVLTDAYYRVVDDTTEEELVPFSTGSVAYTKLSWNDYGNFFRIHMEFFPAGRVYRFDLGYRIGGDWNVIRGDAFKFRTE